MKRILNFRVVEGDPNEVDKNEINTVEYMMVTFG